MAKLLILAPGELGGALLEQAARGGPFASIVVAGRSLERARARANNARIGAALEGRYPTIEALRLDPDEEASAARLARLAPDCAFAAPSLLPWWAIARLAPPRRALAEALPFGAWLACHLAPMLAVRRLWEAAGLGCPWVGASYPDVVNHLLACTGQAPTCGAGNLAEIVPKVRLAVAGASGVEPGAVRVRLVAQHALEYFVYAAGDREGPAPPFLLEARAAGRDRSAEARAALLEPCPIPYGPEFNRLTASAALPVLAALAGAGPIESHVPAPAGRLGGYPVRVAAGAVALDLAPGWSEAQAEAVNRASLPWDGIEAIEGDGTVRFTAASREALAAFTGHPVERLAPADAPAMAAELLAACRT